MKRKYVVVMWGGYYIAKNKKDAIKFLRDDTNADYIILTRAREGNYYHNNINVVAEKIPDFSVYPTKYEIRMVCNRYICPKQRDNKNE